MIRPFTPTLLALCLAAGATAKRLNRPGKVHGWPEMGKDVEILADWFDEHSCGIKTNR